MIFAVVNQQFSWSDNNSYVGTKYIYMYMYVLILYVIRYIYWETVLSEIESEIL